MHLSGSAVTGTIESWVEDVAVRLLEGDRLLLRLAPRVGKTHLIGRLAAALGPTAIVVEGVDFTETGQSIQRAQLQAALSRALEAYGSAQVLFDGYDRALVRSQGARLQAWLTNQLVDGVHARDIGAIFTARCSTAVHREGAGSPLMSRVTPILPPTLDSVTSNSESGSSWFGDAAVITDRISSTSHLTPQVLIDQFELDTSYITDVRGAARTQIERGALDSIHDSYPARCAVHGLLHPGGKTRFLERLEPALLASPETDPCWPEQTSASIDRFVELISGADQILWSDRYMYRDIEPLRSFLQAIAVRSETEIHLLGGREVSDRTVTRAEMARLTSLKDVNARWMTQSDFRDLHERHLVTGPGGWVVPQVHVIVGRQHPGSAVAARTSGFGVDYWTIWKRSIEPSKTQ